MPFVQHVGHAAGHARRKVLPGGSQDHCPASGHVLAAMVAHALHHSGGTGVADAEALSGHTVDEGLAAGGSIESHVAHDDVLPRLKPGPPRRRMQNQLAAGEALAESIVAVPLQVQRQPPGDKCPEGLPAAAAAGDDIAVLRQAVFAGSGDL